MHRSSDLIDETSRLKQFAWEQWDDQVIAVIFRPGDNGLDRYVVKRYVEQVLFQSNQWKQLSSYLSSSSPTVRAYSLTSHETDLMRRILDYHLGDKLRLRITQSQDQLLDYESLLDFICHVQELYRSNSNSHNNNHAINGKKISIPLIPSTPCAYILPLKSKPIIPETKTSPIKSSLPIPSNASPSQSNKPTTVTNSNHTLQSTTNLSPRSTSNQFSLSPLPELCPITLQNAKIDGHGWVQINNVYLPYLIKNHQRLVPYQVLVSCKILEPDELRSTLSRTTTSDITLINSMIRDCKINNEKIPENTFLINIHHVLIGTKNLVYIKILPKDNPTSKINRQYKSILALRGGSLYITTRIVPYVCSTNHSYIPLNDILSIYPNLQTQFKSLARVPRTNELDYLQLVQMYYDERELPSDTLIINMEDLNQTQIISSKTRTLIEHHAREKSRLEQQIAAVNNPSTNKRKTPESYQNKQVSQRFKPSTSSNQFKQSPSAFVRPHFPVSNLNQQNHWSLSNTGHRGKTRWQ